MTVNYSTIRVKHKHIKSKSMRCGTDLHKTIIFKNIHFINIYALFFLVSKIWNFSTLLVQMLFLQKKWRAVIAPWFLSHELKLKKPPLTQMVLFTVSAQLVTEAGRQEDFHLQGIPSLNERPAVFTQRDFSVRQETKHLSLFIPRSSDTLVDSKKSKTYFFPLESCVK